MKTLLKLSTLALAATALCLLASCQTEQEEPRPQPRLATRPEPAEAGVYPISELPNDRSQPQGKKKFALMVTAAAQEDLTRGVDWRTDLEMARAEARKTGRPLPRAPLHSRRSGKATSRNCVFWCAGWSGTRTSTWC